MDRTGEVDCHLPPSTHLEAWREWNPSDCPSGMAVWWADKLLVLMPCCKLHDFNVLRRGYRIISRNSVSPPLGILSVNPAYVPWDASYAGLKVQIPRVAKPNSARLYGSANIVLDPIDSLVLWLDEFTFYLGAVHGRTAFRQHPLLANRRAMISPSSLQIAGPCRSQRMTSVA